jgi:hypothetical protein
MRLPYRKAVDNALVTKYIGKRNKYVYAALSTAMLGGFQWYYDTLKMAMDIFIRKVSQI